MNPHVNGWMMLWFIPLMLVVQHGVLIVASFGLWLHRKWWLRK